MTTVRTVDRLVIRTDALMARRWPSLGPKVRTAYLADRDAWIVLRRGVDAGQAVSQAVLLEHRRTFAGWLRAFRAAARRRVARRPIAAPAVPATAAAAPVVTQPAVARSGVGAGVAVAGGLVLATLLALAAGRKRA